MGIRAGLLSAASTNAGLLSTARVSSRQFALFRIVFGVYLAIHFAHLLPYGAELFSNQGTLADARLSPLYGVFPNVLWVWDSPAAVTALLVVLVVASVCFALGAARHAAAVVLWYGWAALFNLNPLIYNPGIQYIGLLLLLTTLVPAREHWRLPGSRAGSPFHVPRFVVVTAWILMAVGYSYSGIVKLAAPSWVDGTAITHLLNNPLARDWFLRDAFLQLPPMVLRLLTWGALAGEVLFLPLAVWRVTRPMAWCWMASMHIGIVMLVSFADLTLGMLMLHLFTFDRAWLRFARLAWRRRALARARPVPVAA